MKGTHVKNKKRKIFHDRQASGGSFGEQVRLSFGRELIGLGTRNGGG
jgi:hypothetical protein